MKLTQSRAGRFFPAWIFFCALLCPAFGQEALDGMDEDDLIIMENDEGLTVTGTVETTQQMKTLTREDIEQTNAPDLAVLLQETLGVSFNRYGGYGNNSDIILRGFDSERVAFLVDGVPVNSPTSGDVDLYSIDLGSVDHIEVIYGGSDSKYNVTGAFGGVINIITVKKLKPGWHVDAGISNLGALPGTYYEKSGAKADPAWEDLADTQNYTLTGRFGFDKVSLSTHFFANQARNHFLYEDKIFKKTRRKTVNEVFDTGGTASVIWSPDDITKLVFSGDIYYADKEIPTSGYSSIAGKQNDLGTKQSLMLDAPRVFSDAFSTEASFTHNWRILEYSASKHDYHVFTGINRWGWYPRQDLTVRAGGDFRYITLDSTDMGVEDRADGGVYLSAEWRPVEKFLVIPSVKAVFGPNTFVPVPKLGLVFYPSKALTLKNNYFRNFKMPDFEDLYWPTGDGVEGNPDLKPEDGWGTDLGAEYRFPKWVTLEIGLFAQYIADSIHWTPGADGIWRPANSSAGVTMGADPRIRADFPLDRGPFTKIGVVLSYQYMLSRLLGYGYVWTDDKVIPYLPAHNISAQFSLSWKSGSVLLGGHYESLRYTDTANLTEINSPLLINVSVNQKIGRHLTSFLTVRNLLNKSWESFKDYPMPGLTMTLGVRAQFEGDW
jgi:vitamin B12 transporter